MFVLDSCFHSSSNIGNHIWQVAKVWFKYNFKYLRARTKVLNVSVIAVRGLYDLYLCYSVLSTVPVMFNYWAKGQDCLQFCHYLNDDIANTVLQHPDRFHGLGTLPMQDPNLR